MSTPYHVQVSQFEGPLDLLLHLIENAELDIKDIFVSEITTQYLSYMDELDELDMDTASEFLALAATLLYIKSRQLLPRPQKEELEQEEDPEALLIRQLREYKLFKQAGELLLRLQEQSGGMYTRLGEDYALPDQEIVLSAATLDMLHQSFFALMHAQPEEKPSNPLHRVQQDAFTVRMQIEKIREVLRAKECICFEAIFKAGASRLEILVTFMALLEMVARGEVLLMQDEPFASIRMKAASLLDDDHEANYMDEIME